MDTDPRLKVAASLLHYAWVRRMEADRAMRAAAIIEAEARRIAGRVEALLEHAALPVIEQQLAGVLSEGQASKQLGMELVEYRALADRLVPPRRDDDRYLAALVNGLPVAEGV